MRRWWPLVAICLGTFMLLVDVTIVNVALPSMARSLGSSFADLQWVIDGYALALAALLMVAGSLADRFGRRRLYLVGLIVFALASLVCGLAPNTGVLIAGRIVQGAGGAAMFATTAALLSTTYQGRRRGIAFGVWGAVNGLAASSGPLLGGLLIQAWSWRAIVLVNLPVAVLAFVLTLRVVRLDSASGPASSQRKVRLDLAGAVSFTVAATSLVYGLVEAGARGRDVAPTVPSLAVAAAATAAFVLIELRVKHPMLDLKLFANRSFCVLMLAAVILSAAAFAHLALVSLWLQTVLGLSPIRAGLAVVPLSLASFAVSAGIGRFLQRMAPVKPIAGGLALNGIGLLLLTTVSPASGPTALLPGLIVDGLGVGLATPVLVSATLAALPAAKAGIGGAAVNTFRQLGLAIGLAVLGTLFATRIKSVLGAAGQGSRAGALIAGRVDVLAPGLARQAAAAGLDTVFTAAGVTALVAASAVAILLRRPTRTADTPQEAVAAAPETAAASPAS